MEYSSPDSHPNPLSKLWSTSERRCSLSSGTSAQNSRSVHGDIIKRKLETLHTPTPFALLHTCDCHESASRLLSTAVCWVWTTDGPVTWRHSLGLRRARHMSVSSLSVVFCELPLLEGVSAFTRIQVKSVPFRPRLQAHALGRILCYEVVRQSGVGWFVQPAMFRHGVVT